MGATLRHDVDDGQQARSSDDVWLRAPWADYAAPPWWETMRRPTYGEGSRSSSKSSTDGQNRDCLRPSTDSDGDRSENSHQSEANSSLDRFFVAKVREQTVETVDMLRQAL